MRFRFGFSLCLILFLCLIVAAQQQPPTPPGGTGGGGQPGTGGTGGGTGPGGTPPPGGTQPQPRQPQFGEERDPFGTSRGIKGRIIPAQGMRLQIELYLDGMRLDMTFTDMEGNFKFERQQAGRRYEVRIMLGPDQEYVEEIDFMGGFPAIIHLRPQNIRSTRPGASPSGTVISVASLNVPKQAQKEFNKGRELGQKKKYDEGLARLQKAVEIYPKYAEAFNEMGLIYRRQSQVGPAQEMFQKAINADPGWVYSYLNLASLQLNQNAFAELLQTTQRVLQLNSSLAPAHYFSAVAHASLGNLAEAEKAALAADRSEHTQVPQVHMLLGRIYEARGASSDAVTQYKLYLKENPDAPNAEKVKQAIENLGKPAAAVKK